MLNVNCEGPVFDVPADKDSTPPTLTITFPADQSVLSDTVTITAYAFDNVGLEKVYTAGSNPLPWTQKWIGGGEVQVAPQETEISSYVIGGTKQDVTEDTFKGFSL